MEIRPGAMNPLSGCFLPWSEKFSDSRNFCEKYVTTTFHWYSLKKCFQPTDDRHLNTLAHFSTNSKVSKLLLQLVFLWVFELELFRPAEKVWKPKTLNIQGSLNSNLHAVSLVALKKTSLEKQWTIILFGDEWLFTFRKTSGKLQF